MNPTLWRTCRVLAGTTRLRLFRRIVEHPGETVSQLASAFDISVPRASQELRRLQSRGMVKAVRSGRLVRYEPIPDPQVPSAAPLLAAVREAFRTSPARDDDRIRRIATAFAHSRRLIIAKQLLCAAQDVPALMRSTGLHPLALRRHLRCLQKNGMAMRCGREYRMVENPHPVAQGIVQLLLHPPPA